MSYKQAVLFLLMIIGGVLGIVSTLDITVLFAYRSILYLLFCFFYVQRESLGCTLMQIFVVAFSAVCGELIYVLLLNEGGIAASTNCIAIALIIVIAFVLEKYILAAISVALSLFLTINTGFRIGIVTVALCVVEMMALLIFRSFQKTSGKQFAKRMGVVVLFVCSVVVFINYYEWIIDKIATLTGMSQSAKFRITERLRAFLQFDFTTSQDTQRLDIFKYPFERILQIFPRGLIGENIGEQWLYIDVPMLYLYDIFGSVAAWCIVIWFVVLGFWHLFHYRQLESYNMKMVCFWLMPVIAMLFIINGTFIVAMFQALQMGFILGILSNRRLKQ